jgi:hypothetical protein
MNYPSWSLKGLRDIRERILLHTATDDDLRTFMRYVHKMEDMLDEDDSVDAFGSEGWRHYAGLE